ncbi:DUF6326 family protein [Croceitalea marina]|uniref:DUF6326 family protein n=1 Tax=Croceitalea marina TaxID=1775166 RepID=A0ABW5N0F4_9FLAO
MLKSNIKPQELVSTLWIFILFNMILRDLHEFPTEGYVEEMMSLRLSEEVMLFYAFIVEIPILMIVLSRILNHKANKWANVIAVLVSSLGILYTLPSGDLDEIFFALINSAAFFIILRTVWKVPFNDTL